MITVLHITTHLGGGVGRVLSKVALQRMKTCSSVKDIIVCLEPPKKEHTVKTLRESGVHVEITPDKESLDLLINNADIIQIEWWHHPLMAEFLSKCNSLSGRMIIWSHISGLYFPTIPQSFLTFPDLFLFTTPVSNMIVPSDIRAHTDVVYSSGGFDEIPFVQRDYSHRTLMYGYTGTISPAKIHPDILEFIQAVDLPDFSVDFFGDISNHPLQKNSKEDIIGDKIRIHGFIPDLYSVLHTLDVFVYILNPLHYGTTENALLEAMAAGVVPVVLNNPVESSIVKNGQTGYVVDSPTSFADAIKTLTDNPDIRLSMSKAASADVRSRFSLEKTIEILDNYYFKLCMKPKRLFDCSNIFGSTPFAWFQSCLGSFQPFFQNDAINSRRIDRLSYPILYEQSKSSVFQYQSYFPDDPDLTIWKGVLTDDLTSLSLT